MPVDSPAYVGKLARWTRDAVRRTSKASTRRRSCPAPRRTPRPSFGDLARRYELDGIHFDYARYPNERFDYSRAAIAQFRAIDPPDARRRSAAPTLDAEERIDLFAYPDAFPRRMAGVPRRAHDGADGAAARRGREPQRPRRSSASAAAPDRARRCAQRCRTGAAGSPTGLVDAVAPMAYTQEPARFAEQIAAARASAGGRAVWAGHRRLPPVAGADDREHPDRAQARRRRRHPVLLRQPDQPARRAPPTTSPTVGRAAFATGRPTRPTDRGSTAGTRMVLNWLDYAVIGALPGRDRRVRLLVRALSEDHPRLLPDRSLRAVVGDLLHDRRDRNQHAQLHRRAGRRLRRQHDLPPARHRLHRRAAAGERPVHSGLLPRRAVHVVRAAAAPVRRAGEERRRDHLPGDADVRRRHPPVCDGAGHRGRDAGAGDAGRCSSSAPR